MLRPAESIGQVKHGMFPYARNTSQLKRNTPTPAGNTGQINHSISSPTGKAGKVKHSTLLRSWSANQVKHNVLSSAGSTGQITHNVSPLAGSTGQIKHSIPLSVGNTGQRAIDFNGKFVPAPNPPVKKSSGEDGNSKVIGLPFKPPQKITIDATIINTIAVQINIIHAEMQKLESKKKVLLGEFLRSETGFVFWLSKLNEVSHRRAVLLVLSSRSIDDFIHNSIILNYVQPYIAHNNQRFINFIKNIRDTNHRLQYCAQIEHKLVGDWYKERQQAGKPVCTGPQ
jgi:hypothetical protein